jgi:hypothetical protein
MIGVLVCVGGGWGEAPVPPERWNHGASPDESDGEAEGYEQIIASTDLTGQSGRRRLRLLR